MGDIRPYVFYQAKNIAFTKTLTTHPNKL